MFCEIRLQRTSFHKSAQVLGQGKKYWPGTVVQVLFVFTLCATGVFRGGHDVLVRAKLALSDGVTMQITVRSTDAHVSEIIASAVG